MSDPPVISPQSLIARTRPLPEPADPAPFARALADLEAEARNDTPEAAEARMLLGLLDGNPNARNLIAAAIGGSPFLGGIILRDAGYTCRCLLESPEALSEKLRRGFNVAADDPPDQTALMFRLRRRRARAALLVALSDLAGAWSLDDVTQSLTRFADTAVNAAVDALLAAAHSEGEMTLPEPSRPGTGSGYVVLAMGKHGAFELNYSSDIDLIVFYDAEVAPLAAGVEPQRFFVRLTRKLVKLLQEVTEDGYTFRVDLRLRPDPRATQIAVAVEAAAVYYESMGQNWERAAMIKARAAAGDIALGEELLQRLAPYVWRKYLDFAAIADVQSMKRQIHAAKGHATVAIHGHNVKLGRGGIREIEFFVQTQQLIAGGRNPKLRGRRTLDMLNALAEAQWITPETAEELKRAYTFLRRVEHRIQMVADEQTHSLPNDSAAFERLARLAGFASSGEFETALQATFELVQGHYAALFEDAPELASDTGSLVFTGVDDDPETIATLTRMGFRQPSEVSATIRGWHFGRYPATRSARARERLTELMPLLLAALARSGDADHAFTAFDRFMAGLPAGVQLFSLLRANPHLLDLIATILGTAPRLADELRRRPKVLDAVLDPGFFEAPLEEGQFAQAVAGALPEGLAFEETLDRARVIGKEQSFRIGVRLLSQTIEAADAGRAYSALAEALAGRLLEAVRTELAERHGEVAGGRAVVLAMGKLGGREMTAASDIDLILIYDHAPDADASDGDRPLSASQYFARMTQRLISSLASPTPEGSLYSVDMRLRPSGNQGPVATRIDSFRSYHRGTAWTWEKLALTRARVVAGDAGLAEEVRRAISEALTAPNDAAKVAADVLDMRRRLAAEFGGRGLWDLKHAAGGLIDVEFIAQGLQVTYAAERPGLLDTNTAAALAGLGEAGLLTPDDATTLRDACTLFHRLTHLLRLCVDGRFDPQVAPDGLKRLLADVAGEPDLAAVEDLLIDTQGAVRQIFEDIFGQAAALQRRSG